MLGIANRKLCVCTSPFENLGKVTIEELKKMLVYNQNGRMDCS